MFIQDEAHSPPFRYGMEGSSNVQGEDQKKLDVVANDLFINMLRSSYKVAMMVSEENDTVISGDAPSGASQARCLTIAFLSPLFSDILAPYGIRISFSWHAYSPRTICVCVRDEVRDLPISDLTDSYSLYVPSFN